MPHEAYPRPARFSESEWHARVQLAAAYRIFDLLGWTELIYNHLSLRVPGEERHFLINPFGLHYSEVCASNLVKIDLQGRPVSSPGDHPVNPAGFTIHGAIHEHVEGAHCVMHVHTTATMAVCSLLAGLSYTNFYAAQLHGKVAWHEFEGITTRPDEGARIVESARGKPVLMLRNHGPVVMGSTVAQAFSLLWLLQRACEIQVMAAPLGPLAPIAEPVLQACVRDSLQFDPRFGAGQDAFDALTRLVDRRDPSYRR